MALSAIGVKLVPTQPEPLFRVRIKQRGDLAWRDAQPARDCCETEALHALVTLGLTRERAWQLIDAARARGMAGSIQH